VETVETGQDWVYARHTATLAEGFVPSNFLQVASAEEESKNQVRNPPPPSPRSLLLVLLPASCHCHFERRRRRRRVAIGQDYLGNFPIDLVGIFSLFFHDLLISI